MATTRSKSGVKTKIRELRWPALGVVRRASIEGQPEFREPFPSPWSMNCRLEDSIAKRLRGGSRPTLTIGAEDLEDVNGVTALLSVVGALKASAGAVPSGCTHGCYYRDRLVLGGADNAVYVSRQGDYTDWDYGADAGDSGRAMPLQLSEASEVGEAATAFLPFQDTSMLAATLESLWLFQGDPAATGSLRNLSRGVGITGPRAWCAIHDARVGDAAVRYAFVFLSSLGLFMISPSGDGLQSLSEDRIPEELKDIPETTTTALIYSPEERGIYVFVTPATGTAIHWFFDVAHQGFWPFTDDAGADFDSYVLIGPLRLSGPDTFGLLTEIHGMIGAGSGAVSWRIITGDTAEEACANGEAAITAYLAGLTATAEAYAKAAGTWHEGRSQTRYPRVRAMWMCVLLKAVAPWAYESITVQSRDAGNWR